MAGEPRLGIDIGRVIMAPVKGGKADTSFLSGGLEQAMRTPPSPGAFEGVRVLTEVFGGRVWLVSKAGETVQRKTLAWLEHWDFYRLTGLPRAQVRFCLKRPDKAVHCRELQITHFIDDRLDVLEHLRGLAAHLYLFGEQPQEAENPEWLTPVRDWAEVTAAVLRSAAPPAGGAGPCGGNAAPFEQPLP